MGEPIKLQKGKQTLVVYGKGEEKNRKSQGWKDAPDGDKS